MEGSENHPAGKNGIRGNEKNKTGLQAANRGTLKKLKNKRLSKIPTLAHKKN